MDTWNVDGTASKTNAYWQRSSAPRLWQTEEIRLVINDEEVFIDELLKTQPVEQITQPLKPLIGLKFPLKAKLSVVDGDADFNPREAVSRAGDASFVWLVKPRRAGTLKVLCIIGTESDGDNFSVQTNLTLSIPVDRTWKGTLDEVEATPALLAAVLGIPAALAAFLRLICWWRRRCKSDGG